MAFTERKVMIEKLEGRNLFSFNLVPTNAFIGPVQTDNATYRMPQAPLSSITSSVVPGYYDGINVNTSEDASKVIPVVKKLGIKGVRIWVGMKTWDHRGNGQAFLQAQKYKKAGLKVMMQVGNADVPSNSQATGLFKWMKSKTGFSSVDMFQIGNEVNHYKSFHGSLNDYMRILKIAWKELKPAGAKILGAGPTWDVEACKKLKSLGYLNYVDYAAFHPYGNSANQVIERLKAAKAVFSSKPLIVSEWNIRGQSNNKIWASEIKKARTQMNRYSNASYYFCLVKCNTLAGPAGAVTTSFQPNGYFYDAVYSFNR